MMRWLSAMLATLWGCCCALGLAGCGGARYRVDPSGNDFKGLKSAYREGERVTAYYDLIGTDVDYRFTLDGETLNTSYDPSKGYILRFTMPAHDVVLDVVMTDSMTAPFASAPVVNAPGTYAQITQEEAARRLEEDWDCVLLDVRTPEEYAEGHIPGAVNLPNETIGEEMPEVLPDLEQEILVYCRSGRRSKEAAQKLADMGYTGVLEFGGINDWTGEIEQ